MLEAKANQIMTILEDMPEVKRCRLYGSLSDGTYDALSDIDIEVDVSGYDNGRFMLELPERLGSRIHVYYSDYAPSLVPERYIVSIAVDEKNPFCMADLCCTANPHCHTVSKEQIRSRNEECTHILKLWTANLKHFVRGTACREDILRMGARIGLENQAERRILVKTLEWLEKNAPDSLGTFMISCRSACETLI